MPIELIEFHSWVLPRPCLNPCRFEVTYTLLFFVITTAVVVMGLLIWREFTSLFFIDIGK